MSYTMFDLSADDRGQQYEYNPLPSTPGTEYIRVLKLYPECVCSNGENNHRKLPVVGVGHCYWCEQTFGEFDTDIWEELYGQSLEWPADTNLDTWSSKEQCLSPRCMMLRSKYDVPPTRVELEMATLWPPPEYEALSYAWGSTELSCATAYGSRDRKQYMDITESCSQALFDLQPRCTRAVDSPCTAQPRSLWIDALCIDQNSLEERSYQVGLMGSIYRSARRVVVWPGPQRSMTPLSLNLHDQSPVYGPAWRELLDFATKPYFNRIWPIQETALSRECVVLVGASTSAASDEPQECRIEDFLWPFQEAHPKTSRDTWLRDPVSVPYDFCPELRLHRQMWAYFHLLDDSSHPPGTPAHKLVEISRMLLAARRLNASEPRDKVFALQGMFDAMHALFPPPKYASTVEDVYHETTREVISYDETLLILAGITGHRIVDDMPSWVPDYSDSDSITEVDEWEKCQAAGSSSISTPEVMSSRRQLKLEGFTIDRVSQIFTAFSTVQELQKPHQLVQELYQPLVQNLLPREEYLDFLRRLISPTWEASKHKWPLASIIRRLLGDVLTTEVSKQLAETLHPIRENLIKRLDRKVLCRSHGGRLCLVSKHVCQDDAVALLAGCNLPMVLRAEDNEWKLVAPALVCEPSSSDDVKDVMDGSLWAHLQTFRTPQQFTIV